MSVSFSPDYAKGFGGKYGVETEKVDKSALGYDYKGETEKHQSQKGEFESQRLSVVTPSSPASRLMSHVGLHQIIQRASGGSSAWRRTKWTKQLWATTTKERRRNISHRKVRGHSHTCVTGKPVTCTGLNHFLSAQITQQVSGVDMESRPIARIRSGSARVQ